MQHNVTLPEVKAFRLVVNYILLGYTPGLLLHGQAQSTGQNKVLSLLNIFAELLEIHFHKFCFLQLCLWSHSSCEIAGLEQELNPCQRSSWSA